MQSKVHNSSKKLIFKRTKKSRKNPSNKKSKKLEIEIGKLSKIAKRTHKKILTSKGNLKHWKLKKYRKTKITNSKKKRGPMKSTNLQEYLKIDNQ